MSVEWDDFLQDVLIEVDGCPEALALREIRRSAIRFCQETRIWREDLDPVLILPGIERYTLDPPLSAEVIDINIAYLDGKEIAGPVDFGGLTRNSSAAAPDRFALLANKEIVVWPIPAESAGQFVADAILKPSRDSTQGPDILFDDWLEPIAAGARAHLQAMSKRDWADPNASAMNTLEYRRGRSKARAVAVRQGRQHLTMKPRELGA